MSNDSARPAPEGGIKWGIKTSRWYRVLSVLGSLTTMALVLSAGHKW